MTFSLARPVNGGVSSDQTQIYIEDVTTYGGDNPPASQISVHVVPQMLGLEENISLTTEAYLPDDFTNIAINLKDDGILAVYGFAVNIKSQVTVTTSMHNHVVYDTTTQKLERVVVDGASITYVEISLTDLLNSKTLITEGSTIYYDIVPYKTCSKYPELFYRAKSGNCKDKDQLSRIVRQLFHQLWGGAVVNFGQEKYEEARDCFIYISKLFDEAKYHY